jgi:CheY-like chemotaxis protein
MGGDVSDSVTLETSRFARRVLLVEDHDVLRSLVRHALDQEGCSVTDVGSTLEAVRAFDADSSIDTVVTDLRFPDGPTGIDLVRHVRALRPATHVVVTTGHVGDVATLCDLPVLHKPFGLDALLEAVRSR